MAWHIDPRELAVAQKEPMNICGITGRGFAVPAHDITLSIDSGRASSAWVLERAGEIDRCEFSLTEQKQMGPALDPDVAPHYLAATIDLERVSFESARHLNRREQAVAEQKPAGCPVSKT